MTTYVRVREDASSALSLGLAPGASYPVFGQNTQATTLRVLSNSGSFVNVPRKFLEL